ncbi:hypothetical protein BBJ28_00005079 [Nothophytophthora sp. Chile5]|nr:hypothetical protein BBJ28_00005079 [Nothophytophthora sp. Chile5]
MATLRRRLQSLVATSVHEAAASRLLEVQAADHLTGKRRVLSRSLLSASEVVKRRRTTCRASGCSIFPSIGDDCVRTIISFLDGKEVMHQRLLNRFAAEFLPSCVLSLTVEAAQLARGLASPSSSMRQMTNLQGLVIHKAGTLSLAPTAVTTGSTSTPLYAWGCAELPASQANDGEDAVLALAQALDSGSFRNLKKLQLVSVFVNTRSRNALRALCQALIDGGCPLLEDLLLAGNSLADFGALEVARLLTVASAPRLIRLDLRRNFIGETGLHAVLAAFAQTQKLQTQQTSRQLEVLCMGGNLVTDNCVAALQTLLAGFVCPQLRFLGLEDNFLSVKGVQLVLEAAAVCTDSSPRVRRVSCDRGVAGEAADA